jgi:hypothetical protein
MRRRYSSPRSGKDFTSRPPITVRQGETMKTLRQLSVALVFALALTAPALAGDIETGKTPPPPSNQTIATADGQIETTVAGQIETGSSETTAADSATEVALSLLQSVLSLF